MLTISKDQARQFILFRQGLLGEHRFIGKDGAEWKPLGPVHTMAFALDHFTGCRFGLFMYSAEKPGGSASFRLWRTCQ